PARDLGLLNEPAARIRIPSDPRVHALESNLAAKFVVASHEDFAKPAGGQQSDDAISIGARRIRRSRRGARTERRRARKRRGVGRYVRHEMPPGRGRGDETLYVIMAEGGRDARGAADNCESCERWSSLNYSHTSDCCVGI